MCSKVSVCCFVFVIIVFWLQQCASLKIGDKGVCDSKVSIQKKKVFFTKHHKWRRCKGQPCVVRYSKFVWETNRKSQPFCCAGWQYDNKYDVCKPICATGCVNGTCVSPDICQCPPPLYLEPQRKNTCLPPTCETPCVNGKCTSHNSCTCFEGFKMNNFTCEPVCPDCANGICVAPNNCSCNVGFTAVNGTCVRMENRCLGRDCVCREGYEYTDGKCLPKCEYCINGECTAPNKCVCYDGYRANESNPEVCYRPCLPACGGECDIDGQCPEVACEPLPARNFTLNREDPRCKMFSKDPTCYKKSGKKTIKLECCDGWLFNNVRKRCEVHCSMGCVNGTCRAPDICYCEPPLKLQKVGRVSTCLPPVCKTPCHNSNCIHDDTCECLPQFHYFNETYCIPLCGPGFKNDPFDCRPICSKPCVNGVCSAPDNCSCRDGYDRVDQFTCQPHCDLPCEGNCASPNQCACARGYQLAPDGFTCQPFCEHNCVNGYCSGPNECACHEGHRHDLEDKFLCQPVCEPPCQNASCVSPNRCSCNDGYENITRWQCRPTCKLCENGDCVAPDTCECKAGYKKNDGLCKPVCEPPCLHGHCIGPNNCSCEDGYQAYNKSICTPICKKYPEHSQCVEPNTWNCVAGYEKSRDKCKPICKNECKNGYCFKPDVCLCYDGFEANPTNTNVCDPKCPKQCVNSTCDAPDHCKCMTGYRPTADTYACEPFCESCANGTCVAPNLCICNEGYTKIHGICRPVCKNPCVNGFCSSPDKCSCYFGYYSNGTSECSKPCEGVCDDGKCDSNGTCICNSGFEKVNGTCLLTELVSCDACGGGCAEERCACADGAPCAPPPVLGEHTTSTSMAGLHWGWQLGGGACFLLVVMVLVVLQRLWARRNVKPDPADDCDGAPGSVMYDTVVPNMLIRNHREDPSRPDSVYEEVDNEPRVDDGLLRETRVDERL